MKFVLQTIPMHYMSMFLLSVSLIDEIQKNVKSILVRLKEHILERHLLA